MTWSPAIWQQGLVPCIERDDDGQVVRYGVMTCRQAETETSTPELELDQEQYREMLKACQARIFATTADVREYLGITTEEPSHA